MAFEPIINPHLNIQGTELTFIDATGDTSTNPTGWGVLDHCYAHGIPFDTQNVTGGYFDIFTESSITPGTPGTFLARISISPSDLPSTYSGAFAYNISPYAWTHGNGNFLFSYLISTSFGCNASPSSHIPFTVSGIPVINEHPTATSDTYTVNQNSQANLLDVLANDSDSDGGTLTITGVTVPSNGTTISTAGLIWYTPNHNYIGTDTFQYTIQDGQGGFDTETVTIAVEELDYTGTKGDLNICLLQTCSTLTIEECTTVLNSSEPFYDTGWKYDPSVVSDKVYIDIYDHNDVRLDTIYLLNKDVSPIINLFPSPFKGTFSLPDYKWTFPDGVYKFKYFVENVISEEVSNIYELASYESLHTCKAQACRDSLWRDVFALCETDPTYQDKLSMAQNASILLAGVYSNANCLDLDASEDLRNTLASICEIRDCETPGCGCN